MARVLWFVVKDEAGEEVGRTPEFARALALKRQRPGRVIEQEWAAGPRLERSAFGGET